MCGIIGIFRQDGAASAELYEGLLMLQHRGQDSAGMVTFDGQRFMEKKDNGLVANIFDKKSIDSLKGSVGIGHVRYPTAGGLSATEAQPFFVNSPLGIYLIHNGNLTNVDDLQRGLGGRMMKTNSDSEVLLNVFAEDVNNEIMANPDADTDKVVFDAVTKTMKKAKGAYSCITMVNQVGLFAFGPNAGISRSSSVSARRRPTRRRTSGASPPRTPRSDPSVSAACATSTRARRFSSPPTGRWSRDSASTPNSPRASSSTSISLARTPPSTPSACTSSSSRSAAASRSASRRANGDRRRRARAGTVLAPPPLPETRRA